MYYKIIDDVISKDYQKYIQSVIYDMMWAYKPTLSSNTPIAEDENFVDVPGFSKVFYNQDDGVTNQLLYNTAMPLAHICCSKINVELETIYYGRSFLQVPLQDKSGLSNPHIDITNFNHLVCLYYVFDSDGDTVFFDKKSDSEERPSFKDYKIIDRVTPKQGRVVLFDGRQYHANYLPRKSDVRSVINMNLGADYTNVLQ